MASSMTHRQRLENCIAGEKPDRPPVALWRHFPVDDQDPLLLAAATLDFQQRYDFDFIKVTPASSFSTRDWGVKDVWIGSTEGNRKYTQRVIQHPDDWLKLQVLDPTQGSLGSQLKCLAVINQNVEKHTPFIQTVFSPLSVAKYLIGEKELLVQLRCYPEAVHAGLITITKTIQRFIQAALQTGIAGVFYAVQFAQYSLLSEDEFAAFGRFYDLQVLESVQKSWFNVIHLHGLNVMLKQVADYPVQVVNWHDRETLPTLAEAKTIFPGALCGGLRSWDTMVLGSPEDVVAEANDALQTTNGHRFILGTGCVSSNVTPHGNLMAARHAVEKSL
ncbi:MAG: uroporphyrinogen decarboxylase [Anaerolineae bacterium]|nr:uroporphyrinogen decarboxylase [Anaerolineae bacterium]